MLFLRFYKDFLKASQQGSIAGKHDQRERGREERTNSDVRDQYRRPVQGHWRPAQGHIDGCGGGLDQGQQSRILEVLQCSRWYWPGKFSV
jgi:hypothetical protein